MEHEVFLTENPPERNKRIKTIEKLGSRLQTVQREIFNEVVKHVKDGEVMPFDDVTERMLVRKARAKLGQPKKWSRELVTALTNDFTELVIQSLKNEEVDGDEEE